MKSVLPQLEAAVLRRPFMAACLALALVAGVLNYPLWRRGRDIVRRHDEVRQRGEMMLAALANRELIHGDLNALEEALDAIERNTVREESMEVNLGYFYRLEKASRVRLTRIDQLVAPPPELHSPFKAVPVALQVAGQYRNLLGFIRELETGPRILRIRSYRFERSELNPSDLVLVINLDLLART
jgi:Tfp pilus assembly protein PilO